MEKNKHNKSSEPTRESVVALRGEYHGRAVQLDRCVAIHSLGEYAKNIFKETVVNYITFLPENHR